MKGILQGRLSSIGIDYSGSAYADSNPDLSFKVAIRKASKAKVFAGSALVQVSNVVLVGPSNVSLSGILCVRHSMTQRSLNATQDKHRYGG